MNITHSDSNRKKVELAEQIKPILVRMMEIAESHGFELYAARPNYSEPFGIYALKGMVSVNLGEVLNTIDKGEI